MKNKTIPLMLFFCLILLPLISSETAFYIPQYENYSIKVSADIDGARLSGLGACNISINYLNSTPLVSDGIMTNLNNGYFNYTLTSSDTDIGGEYFSRIECSDSGMNDTSVFIYEVNPTGIRPSDQKTASITRSIYFVFGLGILFFIAFLFYKGTTPMKWTFCILSFIFFLIGLNVLFVGLQDEVVNSRLISFFDNFTAVSFIMYWFLAGILIIMWFFTIWQTIVYKQNMDRIARFGGE